MTDTPFRTALTDLLGIRHPVVLAGMAGGPTTPALVAAVSRGGGLGVFGAMGMSRDALAAAVTEARTLAPGRPVGVNVLLAGPTEGNPDPHALDPVLRDLREGAPATPPPAAPPSGPRELVEAALEAGAAAVSVGLGDPAPVADLARGAGVPLIAMVTTVEEARIVVASGADAVVAQGWEAGGHRSTFAPPPEGGLPSVGTIALVARLVAELDVPVVAAGGIMDGRGLAAALCLGAAGVQLGTRFLSASEAGVPPSYRARLRAARDTDSRIICALSGRPARGLPNDIVRRLESGPEPLGWPRQAAAWADVRTAAARADDAEHIALWAGQASALIEDAPRGAEEILAGVVAEAASTLRGLAPPA
ncbi:MAG TPA: nitronate monooxygenase [Miltoncostaeaceae bacterium]|nr:nitronate monooxygenase [Miltoncostaeaceae bacterium]